MAASIKLPAGRLTPGIMLFLWAYILTILVCCEAARLNVPKVLLPYYSNVATNFTLEVKPDDRCYTWKSSRSDVATITPIDPDLKGCSTKAFVTAVSKHPGRMTSIILAEDGVTGQVLRCDVIVVAISSIQIVTTTRELYLEDSPEEFQVKAMDTEGNTFSSLAGIAFEWGLISDTESVDAHNLLRIITFGESAYKTRSHITDLEQRGLQGDRILVNGIRTGTAKVTVALRDTAYKQSVKPDIVRLIVIANIMLTPSMVYVLVGADVKYRVDLIGQTTTSEILMPSEQYYLEVVDDKTCSLNAQTSTITAIGSGDTEVVLKDKNIIEKEAFRMPSAGVHVVYPGYIGFQVMPGRKWILEVDRVYEITIEIFDKDSHKIHPSDNIRVVAKFPNDSFQVLESSRNGTYHIVKTVKGGHTQIAGHLVSVISKDGKEIHITPPITNLQAVEIYDRIAVIPSLLVFPWDPTTKTSYIYQLKATGGSGNYTWSTSEVTIATVNIHGQIASGSQGVTHVIARDVKNVDNKGTMEVHVVPPIELSLLPSVVEAEIGTDLTLPVALYTYVNQVVVDGKTPIADCSHLPLKISLDSHIFQHLSVEPPIVEGSCASLRVKARNLGNTELIISYSGDNVYLEDKMTIAAFLPLKLVNIEGTAVVTVGSSLDLILTGGPQAWILNPSKYFQKLSVELENIVATEKISSYGLQKNYHVFHVLCKDIDEQILIVKVGNGETSKNLFPVTALAKIRFSCAAPVGLHLNPVISQPNGLPPCPITQDSNHAIPVYSHKDFDINVWVTDSNGRKFDNFTSLSIDWRISDASLAVFNEEGTITEIQKTTVGVRTGRTYQNVQMSATLGSLMITATIDHYRGDYFSSQYIRYQETINPAISQTLVLMLVEDAVLAPSSVHMFNHPDNKVKLTIEKGSGYFHIDQAGSNIAKTTYDVKTKKVTVIPQQEGIMVMTVFDLCLPSEKHATADIYVAGVATIDVNVIDKVQIYKEIYATVRVLDSEDQPLLAKYFTLMDLKPSADSNIISVKPYSSSEYTTTYLIHGQTLGTTSLTMQAVARTGQVITSRPRDIQVFPPLRLDPRNITLIIGALFQVISFGGPQPQSTIEYSVLNSDTASVSSSALIEALELGNTTITGRAVGIDPETGQTVVYSQDMVNVYVVMFNGIRIHAPLTRIQAGTQMPVYAMGVNEPETPFSFGSALPPLTLTWSINNKEVATLKSVFHRSGIKVGKESNFAMRLSAKQEGHITIKVRATVATNSRLQVINNLQLTDSVQIQVFEKLTMIQPDTCDGRVVMTPSTETIIKTNRDSSARKVTYRLLGQGHQVVTLGPGGQLKSGVMLGQTSLLITSLEEFSINQTTVVLIQVKPVAYMMLNVDTVIRSSTSSRLVTVPLGAVLRFTVSYHDDIGQMFHATNTRLKLRPNRFDLLQVSSGKDNGTLVAMATEEGQTVLRVWDEENPRISDFINIQVGVAIYPSRLTATVGDIICFSSPLLTDAGHGGLWKANGDAVRIGSLDGIGTATTVGQVQIVYNVSQSLVTHTEINVKPVSRLELLTSGVPFISNSFTRSKSYVVPVILLDGDTDQSGDISSPTNMIGNNCSVLVGEAKKFNDAAPFYCEMSLTIGNSDIAVSDIFHVRPILDTKTGFYACKLTESSAPDLASVISGLDTSIRLRAVIPPTDQQPAVTSKYSEINFLPAFHVASSDLLLSNLIPVAKIRITTTGRVKQELKVIPSDSAMLEVLPALVDAHSDNVIYVPVQLVSSGVDSCSLESRNLFVEVSSPLTGQRHRVNIQLKIVSHAGRLDDGVPRIEGVGKTARGWAQLGSLFLGNYLNLLVIIMITFVAMLVGYCALTKAQKVVNPEHINSQGRPLIGTPPPYSPTGVGYYTQSPPSESPFNRKSMQASSPYSSRLWSSGYEFPDRSLTERRTSPNRSPYQ